MHLFLAGTSVSDPENELKIQQLFKRGYKLHSYFHLFALEKHWFKMNTENKVHLFLDSGAFSAWTSNVQINIQEYIQFIKDNEERIDVYANLDVIGIGGKQPNELTAKLTLKNQRIMEKAGLIPLPCFHYGEPLEYLDYYIEHYDYLALGVAGNSGKKIMPWLNECFLNHICNDKGIPKIKIHGFAVTSLRVMLRYPFWSVDSTSWVVTGRMGSIFIPRYKAGKWVYDESSWKIMVSNRSPGMKIKDKHIDTISPMERKIFLEYIHEKGYVLGKSDFKLIDQKHELAENERWAENRLKNKTDKRMLETIIEPGISNKYQLRDEINIIYFLDLEKSRPKYPWAFKMEQTQKGLF